MIVSRPFTLVLPSDPARVLRGVIDRPAEAEGPLVPVLVLHGFKGFFRWGFFPTLGRRLAEAGFAAVRSNHSGSGVGADLESFTEDAAFEANTPARQVEDARFVLESLATGDLAEQLQAEGAPDLDLVRLGLVGHSMGGAVALLLAGGASPHPPAAVVTWAAVASFDRFDAAQKQVFQEQGRLPIPNARTGQVHHLGRGWLDALQRDPEGLDPVAACGRLRAPTLLLHGTDDTSVPFAEAERLAAAGVPDTVRLEQLPGEGHTFGARHPAQPDLLSAAPGLARALEQTEAHLVRHLR